MPCDSVVKSDTKSRGVHEHDFSVHLEQNIAQRQSADVTRRRQHRDITMTSRPRRPPTSKGGRRRYDSAQ